MNDVAKTLIVFGLVIAGAGLILGLLGKIPGVGRLPGDVWIRRENFSFYFPLTTCILISVIITVIINLFFRK